MSEIAERLLLLADTCAEECDCEACFLLGCLARDCGYKLRDGLHHMVLPLSEHGSKQVDLT